MTSNDGNVFMVELRTTEDEQQDVEEPKATASSTNTNLKDENQHKPTQNIPQAADKEIIDGFLSGSQCLYGVRSSYILLLKLRYDLNLIVIGHGLVEI
jgi:hypothetical protein